MTLKADLRDKLALMYSLAGSQRKLADWVSVSHQKIGRILHAPEFGGYADSSRALKNPELKAAVEAAFSVYKDIARQQARDDGLPFDEKIPLMLERLPMPVRKRIVDKRTGEIRYVQATDEKGRPLFEPGLRAVVKHAHWLSDEQRRAALQFFNTRAMFHHASVGSYVDLKSYFKASEQYWRENERKGKFRTPEQEKHRINLKRKARSQQYGFIWTKMTPLGFPKGLVFGDVERQLREKHIPAASDKNAKIADQLLVQIDINRDSLKQRINRAKLKSKQKRAGSSPRRKR